MDKEEKYLGVKIIQQGNRVSYYNFLIEKSEAALAGWRRNTLSHAERTVLIQSVLALIPVYYMATTSIPITILNKLTQIIRDFWWGHDRDRRKMHFLRWDWFNLPKEKGGLGLQSLSELNQALVAKLAWRFLHDQDALWVRILQAKYLRNNSWDIKKTDNCSSTWAAMLDSRENLKKGCLWLVGDGRKIKSSLTHGYHLLTDQLQKEETKATVTSPKSIN